MRQFIGLLLISWSCWVFAAPIDVPPYSGSVLDQTGTLSAQQQQQLTERLDSFKRNKGAQLAVFIVATTGEETIEQYSMRVVENWKLGREGVNDGLLFLIAKEDRALRIEVGYGLEGVISDAIASRIIQEWMVPAFKEGDYFKGINAGVGQAIRLIHGEALPPPKEKKMTISDLSPEQKSLFFLILTTLLTTYITAQLFSIIKVPVFIKASVSAFIGSGILYKFGHDLPFVLACAGLCFYLGLKANREMKERMDDPNDDSKWGSGGSGGSGSSGGSSSRSSSGRGGSFGGGGSSGNW